MKYKKGQQIEITGNEIFKIMGFNRVTGIIVLVNESRTEYSHVRSIHFKCNETGSMELFSSQYGGEVAVWS